MNRYQLRSAGNDLALGLCQWKLWLTLAWFDIKLRYRRTVIGPCWLALTSIITTAIMGFVYAKLFNMQLRGYFPYLACGLTLWSLISSFANDAPNVFISSASLARQAPLPFIGYILRRVTVATLVFFHTFLAFVVVGLFFGIDLDWSVLLALPALGMILLFGCWLTLLLGVACLRYRDLSPIVAVTTQSLFFITPIFFERDKLGAAEWVAQWNPLNHMIDIMRAPLLGTSAPLSSWGIVALMNVCGMLAAFIFFARYRSRLTFWM